MRTLMSSRYRGAEGGNVVVTMLSSFHAQAGGRDQGGDVRGLPDHERVGPAVETRP